MNSSACLGGAAAAGIAGIRSQSANAEPPPETTRIRLLKFPSICIAPVFVAEVLLRAEGFTDISYVGAGVSFAGLLGVQIMGEGLADIGMGFAASLVIGLDRGAEISVLGGVHVGCFELFGSPSVAASRT